MLGDADVVEDGEWLASNVTSQIAAKRARDHAVRRIAVNEACRLDPARRRIDGLHCCIAAVAGAGTGHDHWTVSVRAQVEVVIRPGQDIEGTSRAPLQHRSYSPSARERVFRRAARAHLATLVDAGKDKAVPLVEDRVRYFFLREPAVLGCEQ